MSHLLVLRHGPLVGPELLREPLDGRAATVRWVEHDLTDDPAVPPLDEVAGLLVLGGRMGVHDDDPWLEDERALLARAVDAGVPTFGVCLGAQQLAVTLGGEVTRRRSTNAAVSRLRRTEDGREHEVMAGWSDDSPAVFHHDDEAIRLPPGAVELLVGGDGAHPAWRDETDTAIAVQFHPEAGPDTVRAWEQADGELDHELLGTVEQAAPFTAAAGVALVMRWVDTRVVPRLDG